MARGKKIADAFVDISTRQQGFDAGLNNARGKLTRFVRQQRGMFSGMVGGINRSMSLIGAGLLGGLGVGGGIAAFIGVERALSSIITSAIAAEESQSKLKATLRSTGNEVENNAARINALADELRDTANVDDDVTRKLASFGLNLGITTDKINGMTEAAIGLAEATGDDVESSMEKLVKANQGSFMALQKQLPLLKGMKTEEEKLAYVQKIAQQGLEQRRVQLNTLGGATTQLKLATGELAESFGGLLAPSLTKATKALTDYVNFIRKAEGESGRRVHFNQHQPLRDQLAAGNQSNLDTLTAMVDKQQAQAESNYNSQRSGNLWNSPMSAMAQVYGRTQNGRRGRVGQTPMEEFRRLGDRINELEGGNQQQDAVAQRAIDKARSRRKELEHLIVGEGSPSKSKMTDFLSRDAMRTEQQNENARQRALRAKDAVGTMLQQQAGGALDGGWASGIMRNVAQWMFRDIDAEAQRTMDWNNDSRARRETAMREQMAPKIGAERGKSRQDEARVDQEKADLQRQRDRDNGKLSGVLGKLELSIPLLIAALRRPAAYSK